MTTTSTEESLWVRCFHPAPERPVQLVCFPHAGGSASFYFPVSAQLAPHAEVHAVQYPGRQDRRHETSPGDLHVLADQVYAALRGSLQDRPTVFFGHSMGATLAFEVTRRHEADGGEIAHLFASGRRAPSRVRDEHVHELTDEGVVEELKLLAGTDTALLGDDEILRMILPAIRSDYRAIETYRCAAGATVRAPLTVLTGDSDPKTSPDEARSWRDHTTGPFDLQVRPGGHFFLGSDAPAIIGMLRTVLTTLA
jgi:surfactin synthase thioesterase subunit